MLITSPLSTRYVNRCVYDTLILENNIAEGPYDKNPGQRILAESRRRQIEERFDDRWKEEFDEGYRREKDDED